MVEWCVCVHYLGNHKKSVDFVFCCNRIIQKNSCLAIIGNGTEENRNSSEPLSASLASPRDICNGIMNRQPVLFIADSNSSTIRVVTLQDGNVTNLVGGDADPTV